MFFKQKIVILKWLLLIFTFIFLIIYLCFASNLFLLNEPFLNPASSCCIYAYYEKDEKYLNNFKFFIKNGILDHVDYFIVINGKCSLDIEKAFAKHSKHVTIIYRENTGFDFGAYCHVINGNYMKRKYDYYFFINTSVKGPYLVNSRDWVTPFIKLFNDNVQVVGTSINIYHPGNTMVLQILSELYTKKPVYSHIQSMFFGIKHEYLEFLKQNDFFNCEKINVMNMKEIIHSKEIGLSQLALNNGWNINSILSKYQNIDYISINVDFNETSVDGDPYFENAYFSKTIDPYEVIFFKNNRFSSRNRGFI